MELGVLVDPFSFWKGLETWVALEGQMIFDAEAPETLAVWVVREIWDASGQREILAEVADDQTSYPWETDSTFFHLRIQVEKKCQCQMGLQDLLVILVQQ